MKKVKWMVQCETIVNTDDDEVARVAIQDLFENKYWDYTGPCVSTFEDMQIQAIF